MELPLIIRIPPNVFTPSPCGGDMAPKPFVIPVSPIFELQVVAPRQKKKSVPLYR